MRAPNAAASASTSSGNSNGRPCEWIAMSVSMPGAPCSPSTRDTRPTGCALRLGGRVISTITTCPGSRAPELARGHEHPMRHARVVGHEVGEPGIDVQPADDLAGATLEHLDDRALRLAAEARALHPHGDAVAVHHLAHLLRRQVDRRRGVVGQQLAVAVALRLHRPDHEARQLLAQAVLAAAVQHDLAAPHQLLELRRRLGGGRRPERGGDLLDPQRAAGVPEHAQGSRRRGRARSARPGGGRRRSLSSGALTLHGVPSGWGDGPPVFVDSPWVRQ